jgi:hypothetical protein
LNTKTMKRALQEKHIIFKICVVIPNNYPLIRGIDTRILNILCFSWNALFILFTFNSLIPLLFETPCNIYHNIWQKVLIYSKVQKKLEIYCYTYLLNHRAIVTWTLLFVDGYRQHLDTNIVSTIMFCLRTVE